MNTERPEVLYHYTTMNALCNLLNGVTDRGDGQTPDYRFRIWVSCADYMNDPLEGVFFRKCLHEAFLRYQSAHDLPDKSGYMPFAFTALNLNRQTFYAFSLSEHADSLPMWVAYGNNGQGVAIGFDTEEFARAAAEYPYCHFLKMAYRTGGEFAEMFSDEDMARAYEAIRPREDGGCSVCYADYDFLHDKYSHVKNRYYAAEREWRLVFDDRPDLPKQFRERNGLILPYYEIELPLKVIRHFVIGPCTNQALSRSALESMLYHKAREFRKNERKVLLSEVPYVLR